LNAVAGIAAAPHPVQIGADVDSADLVTSVAREVVCAVVRRFKPQLRALVLTGSMARQEATFVKVSGGWAALGDCESLLVFEPHEALPDSTQVADLQQEIELRLKQLGMACPIGLSAVHPRYLGNLQPHIYGYELRTCGHVVWGDAGILALIPPFEPCAIPREDAWRMLCNRMIEQLAATGEGHQPEDALPTPAGYKTIKLCLDLATSLLLFCDEYAPTYQARCARLQRLAEKLPAMEDLPFPLQPFAALVEKATHWKLFPAPRARDAAPSLRPRVWDYARRLWRWELLRLTGAPEELSNACLVRCWMRFQPLPQRLRGWASLARRQGWLASWRDWPHWAHLGVQGSPRHWIYMAGGELFFRLPSLRDEGGETCPHHDLQTWRKWLPVQPERAADKKYSWRQLASEIGWNYRRFLMETSS
jgi:hypothetical protein